jgi:L-ribulose-5-phosphate 3-epimerase
MGFGCRAHDFGRLPPEELAERAARTGFSFVQLALSKAVAGLDARLGSLSPGLAAGVGGAFRSRGLRVAVLGCYINPIHPDPSERRDSVDRFKEHLRFARDFGCSIVATETGSLNADCSPHPANGGGQAFSALVGTLEELAAEAERSGVFACIEGVASHVASTPARLKAVLDAVGSNRLGVLLDPVNLLTPENHGCQDAIMEECFELFGDRVLAVHAKDFAVESGRLRVVPAGTGGLDYGRLFRLLAALAAPVDLIVEDLRPADMAGAIERLTSLRAAAAG